MKQRINPFSACVSIVCCVVLLALAPGAARAGGGAWSGSMSLSGWFGLGEIYRLLHAEDGTVAVIWLAGDAVTKELSFWGRVRAPGKAWSSAANITGWSPNILLTMEGLSMEISPDGTPWLLWVEQDTAQLSPNYRVKCAHADAAGTWQAENLSALQTQVRAADLHPGPGGQVAAVWTECSTPGTEPYQGSCQVSVRRRPAGVWLAEETADDGSGVGISSSRVRVGPSGLVSVNWAEVKPASTAEWKILGKAYNPAGGWDTLVTDVTGWVEPRDDSGWVGLPVMGEDGTEVLAWLARTATGSAFDAVYSATRAGASGNWSAPAKLSADRPASAFEAPMLWTRNGTTVAAWVAQDNTASYQAVFASFRDPMGVWGAEQQLSAWAYDVDLGSAAIWPHDGTCIVLWAEEDDTRPESQDEGVFWKTRSPGGMFIVGGQLGGWVDSVMGAGVQVWSSAGQGGAEALWCVRDSTLPSGQQGVAYTASRPLGSGGWAAPRVLSSGHAMVAAVPWNWALQADDTGLPAWAVVLAVRDALPPENRFNVLLFEKKERPLPWLPLLLDP